VHKQKVRLIEGFSHFVTSMTAPIASGWSDCRVGLAPTGKRLCTAHTRNGHSFADRLAQSGQHKLARQAYDAGAFRGEVRWPGVSGPRHAQVDPPCSLTVY
jgi:hypothetical protein